VGEKGLFEEGPGKTVQKALGESAWVSFKRKGFYQNETCTTAAGEKPPLRSTNKTSYLEEGSLKRVGKKSQINRGGPFF